MNSKFFLSLLFLMGLVALAAPYTHPTQSDSPAQTCPTRHLCNASKMTGRWKSARMPPGGNMESVNLRMEANAMSGLSTAANASSVTA